MYLFTCDAWIIDTWPPTVKLCIIIIIVRDCTCHLFITIIFLHTKQMYSRQLYA